tara:strand:+ start:827 stop:1870 length:1044 start_codon:yes stop_codon:yes gene_type:complete
MPNLSGLVDTLASDDIGLMARVHFATNTNNFERAREFYRSIGYTDGLSGFPLTNTHQMARALGMYDICQYEMVTGEVITMPGTANPSAIDLLQFKTPYNDKPPYDLPNHLGMAYAAFLTTNLQADVKLLRSIGATILSEPFGAPGDQFIFFKDLDGILYKLEEHAIPNEVENKANIIDMPYIAINVSNLEKSLKFYRALGYTKKSSIEKIGAIKEAKAYGLKEPFHYKSANISIDRGDKHALRLTQWITPFNPEPPYPLPINHIGIDRIALVVPNIERAVQILKTQGVKFVSEIAPCCSGTNEDDSGIVHLIDPDGVFLELVGAITKRPLSPQPDGCPKLEIRYPKN